MVVNCILPRRERAPVWTQSETLKLSSPRSHSPGSSQLVSCEHGCPELSGILSYEEKMGLQRLKSVALDTV